MGFRRLIEIVGDEPVFETGLLLADDLALVLVNDDVASQAGLIIPDAPFMRIFAHRMTRFIAPAKEHGKLVAMHTGGKLDGVRRDTHARSNPSGRDR
jgi:hypothetical protein